MSQVPNARRGVLGKRKQVMSYQVISVLQEPLGRHLGELPPKGPPQKAILSNPCATGQAGWVPVVPGRKYIKVGARQEP